MRRLLISIATMLTCCMPAVAQETANGPAPGVPCMVCRPRATDAELFASHAAEVTLKRAALIAQIKAIYERKDDPATGKPPPSSGGPGEVNGPEANGVPNDVETMSLGAKAGAEAGGIAGTIINPAHPGQALSIARESAMEWAVKR